jgi:hypothetical protein
VAKDGTPIKVGWGARIRTWEWRNQNPLPYHLATPHRPHEGRGPQLYSEGILRAILREEAALAGYGHGRYNARSPGAILTGRIRRCPFGLTVGRSVAQPGSALASGARGREFESPRSDHSVWGTAEDVPDEAGRSRVDRQHHPILA